MPSAADIRDDAVGWFKSLYRQSAAVAAERGEAEGERAIRDLALLARHRRLSKAQAGHLGFFALPLGAKRALHFSAFFAAVDDRVATLKRLQADLFGDCHSQLIRDDADRLTDGLEALAACEADLRENTLAL